MSQETLDELEKELARLTTWEGPDRALWKKALTLAESFSTTRTSVHGLLKPVPRWLAYGCVGVAALLVIAITLPSLNAGRQGAVNAGLSKSTEVAESPSSRTTSSPALRGVYSEAEIGRPATGASGRGRRLSESGFPADSSSAGIQDIDALGSQRFVVRKATVELSVADVRAVFLKAAMVLRESSGEYVEDSSLTGSGPTAEGNLTLRVAASRLPEVLNELRALGEVRSEKVIGEDVTEQVVDLDARLRNEQRIEKELLELLDKRNDAPLKDVLEVRQQLSMIRGQIERMVAQRDRLGRMVSLATVLVILRASQAPSAAEVDELGAYFSKTISDSWTAGTHNLAYSISWVVGVLIGGLMWWLMLLVGVLLVGRRLWRSALPKK